jgi:hypothetical protein
MPSIEAAIEARAVAVSGLTALIKFDNEPVRFAPIHGEQGWKLPFVTYQLVSAPRVHVMGADKDSQPRVQFDIWAETWPSARAVRDQLLVAFDRWSGVSAGTTVQASVCENDGLQIEPEDVTQARRLTMEFIMTVAL